MSQENYPHDDIFYYDDKYLYDHQWYHVNFPKKWAVNHSDGTGPGQCNNCAFYGSINGIFIGYCSNCAIYDYNGTRGRGFIDNGIENNSDINVESAFDTYLKGIDIHSIRPICQDEDETTNDDNNTSYDAVYNVEDYLNADPYPNNDEYYSELSLLECHFEGGYNDM